MMDKRIFHFKPLPLTVALCLSLPLSAQAEETRLSAVTVTDQAEKPNGNITEKTITDQELSETQATSVKDIYQTDAEVQVGGGISAAQKIYVRGMESSMMNVKVDGATQQSNIFHHAGSNFIEPEFLKQVTINASPGAATNGPGALSGSIDYVTKDPSDLLRGDEEFGGLVKGGYYSNSNGGKGSLSLFGRLSDNLSYLGSFAQTSLGDFTDGDGHKKDYTGTDQTSGFAKLVAEGGAHKVALSYENVSNNDVYRGRLNFDDFNINRGGSNINNAKSRQKTDRQGTNLKYTYDPSSPWVKAEVTLYYNDTDYDRDMLTESGDLGVDVTTEDFDIRNTTDVSIHNLVYGVDYNHDKAKITESESSRIEKGATQKASVTGVYLQDQMRVTRQLNIGIGARYDNYRHEAKNATIKEDGVSPNVNATFAFTDALSLSASQAYALRGSGLREVMFIDYDTDPNIKAEKARNSEVKLAFRKPNYWMEVTGFTSNIDDYIGYDSNAGQYTNTGNVTNDGYSAQAGFAVDRFTMNVSYSHSKPELDGEPLVDTSGLGTQVGDTWIADLNYDVTNDFSVRWLATFVEEIHPKGHTQKPGYNVHNFYANWQTPVKDLSVDLAVYNVFDTYYLDQATYGSEKSVNDSGTVQGLPEPGRDIRISASYRF